MATTNDPPAPSREGRAPGRGADEIHRSWLVDFKALSEQVQRLHIRRQVFEPIDEAIAKQAKPGSALVLGVLRPMYAEAQASAFGDSSIPARVTGRSRVFSRRWRRTP